MDEHFAKPIVTNPLPTLLKHFRKKSGLTQLDIATALSISRSGYANYEEGRNLPSIEQAIQLSQILGHDLLYAYTMSSRYMKMKNSHKQDMVMETSPYLTAANSDNDIMNLVNNYSLLNASDRKLVDRFLLNMAEKNK